MSKILHSKSTSIVIISISIILTALSGISCSPNIPLESQSPYDNWKTIGLFAAEKSLDMMKNTGASPEHGNLIVITNAGYAEVNGGSTQEALDGLASVTGASRGRNTLLEIHSEPLKPLWFAIFDKYSGYCAYFEIDSSKATEITDNATLPEPDIFSTVSMERINAKHLFEHPSEYQTKFDNKIFGGNEFRIITIANTISAGAPAYAVRVLEFHDHFCPGVTSGILTAQYIKARFPSDSGYFVHSVDPWCKDDALMVMLNATPGKKGYAAYYPDDADRSKRNTELRDASTIVYRLNGKTDRWEGLVLAFSWAETSCAETGNSIIDKLCMLQWYLERLDKYDDFVKVLKEFQLPEGVTPQDLARPTVDPLARIFQLE